MLSSVQASETINFGMGKLLDPSQNQYDRDENGQQTQYAAHYSQQRPKLVECQGNVYTFWVEDNFEQGCSDIYPTIFKRIAVSVSTDLGKTWSSKTNILNGDSDGSRVYDAKKDAAARIVVVSAAVIGGKPGFVSAVLSDGVWTECAPVETGAICSGLVLSLAPDGTLYLMCGGVNEAALYRFDFDATTNKWLWLPQTNQSGNITVPTESDTFDFIIDGNGDKYIFYGSDSIKYRVLLASDPNAIWTNESVVADAKFSYSSWDFNTYGHANVGPDGKVDFTWIKENPSAARRSVYLTSFDSYTTFSQPVQVDNDYSFETKFATPRHPRVFYSGNNIYVSYESQDTINYECYKFDYIARSSDGGLTFSKPFRADWGDYNGECSDEPFMVAMKDSLDKDVFINTWRDDRGALEAYMTNSMEEKIYASQGRLYEEKANVLVVDDDYSGVNENNIPDEFSLVPSKNYHNYESWYIDALYQNGIPFDYYDVAGQGRMPTAEILKKYPMVIWETGCEYNENPNSPATLSLDEQNLIANYLDAGGKLFLCSQDFLRDVTGGFDSPVSNSFANNYLSVSSVLNFWDGCAKYEGVAGDPIGDGLAVETTHNISYINPVDLKTYWWWFFKYINTKNLTHTATPVFRYNGGDIAIRRSADPYSLVFFGFPFETMTQDLAWIIPENLPSNSREEVMAKVINWLKTDQGYQLSRNADFSTSDGFFGSAYTLHVAACSSRINTANMKTAEARFEDKGTHANYRVDLAYNSLAKRFEGNLTLQGKPKGDWAATYIKLEDRDGNRYMVSDVPLNVSTSLEILSPAGVDMPFVKPYKIKMRVRDEAQRPVTVTVSYYNPNRPSEHGVISTNTVNTTGGYLDTEVDFDFTNPGFNLNLGQDYRIKATATVGSSYLESTSPGMLIMVQTVPQAPTGYSNIIWANYGNPDYDYDGDGWSNSDELLYGTDLNNTNSHP